MNKGRKEGRKEGNKKNKEVKKVNIGGRRIDMNKNKNEQKEEREKSEFWRLKDLYEYE